MDTKTILDWLGKRLEERSTWLGLISLLSSLGISLDPTQVSLIAAIGVAVAGGIMVFTKDHSITNAIAEALKDAANELAEEKLQIIAAKAAAPVAPAPAMISMPTPVASGMVHPAPLPIHKVKKPKKH